jgi:hypothetical protein
VTAALRALAEAATPGPWFANDDSPGAQYVWDQTGRLDARIRYQPADARLIALAPELALLAADMGDWIATLNLVYADAATHQAVEVFAARLHALTAATDGKAGDG